MSGRSIEDIAEGKGKKRVWHSNRLRKENLQGQSESGDGGASLKPDNALQARAGTDPGERQSAKKKGKHNNKNKELKGKAVQPSPDFVPPSLATLRETAPAGPEWVHEIKFDGYRIQARLDRGLCAPAHPQGTRLDEQISQCV